MFEQFYSDSGLLIWPLVGLFIFLVAFIAVIFYVLVGLRNSSSVDRLARLPLEGEAVNSVDAGGQSHE